VDDHDPGPPFLQEPTVATTSSLAPRPPWLARARSSRWSTTAFAAAFAVAIVAGLAATSLFGTGSSTADDREPPSALASEITRSAPSDGVADADGNDSTAVTTTEPVAVPTLDPSASDIGEGEATTSRPAPSAEDESAALSNGSSQAGITTTTTMPTLGQLTDQIAASPDAVGDKGPELLELLQAVQREQGDERVEKAEKAMEKTIAWVEEDELHGPVVDSTLRYLEHLIETG
jgi:hypothetical protein